MAAYFIVQSTIGNEQQYQKYREAVVPLIQEFGGKFLVKGAQVEVLEGSHDGRRFVMFEFPSIESIHDLWNSSAYQPVKALREGAAMLDIWAVPGV